MPYKVDLGMPPAGYCIKAARDGEEVEVQVLGFSSSVDGQDFIRKLEGIPNDLLERAPGKRILPSQIDTLAAVIQRDGKATVYVNEIVQRGQVRVSRAAKRGEGIFKNDIVDIGRVEIGIDVPTDCGFLFLFSIGWRKGLFFDFAPAAGTAPSPRSYDLSEMLGRVQAYVMFQERFGITDDEWRALLNSQWFPFAGLHHTTVEKMVAYIRSGWSVDELIESIVAEVKSKIPKMLEAWGKQPLFSGHMRSLGAAAKHFTESEYLSCASILFPRIEGLLRTNHSKSGTQTRPSQEHLPQTAVASKATNPASLLLPHRFESYLREVYFASFDPNDASIGVNRNSVGHGVASEELINEKAAVITMLIVQQLFYSFASDDEGD